MRRGLGLGSEPEFLMQLEMNKRLKEKPKVQGEICARAKLKISLGMDKKEVG